MKVLLVEDNLILLDVLRSALSLMDHDVIVAVDGQQALERWHSEQPDLVLLDCNLPKIDGFEVCRRIRHESATPVIMLTARSDEEDMVRGLQMGADDYIIKPFSARELAARMNAVARRSQADRDPELAACVSVGDLVLDPSSHTVTRAGTAVPLTGLEFRILYMLALNHGRVVPYDQLIQYAWGYLDETSSNLLKTHISHLRTKLGVHAGSNMDIKAVVGLGYSL